VSVPADIVSTLMRSKTITVEDFMGKQTYVLADGSKVPSQQFRIRSIKVGNKTVENVVARIASVNGEILLGQSFLQRFKSWSVDNEQHNIILR
jgi:predicted aspartyl protease